jgi:hypothetical protein
LWEQEKFVGLKYDVFETEDMDVYVENAEYVDTDESVRYEM